MKNTNENGEKAENKMERVEEMEEVENNNNEEAKRKNMNENGEKGEKEEMERVEEKGTRKHLIPFTLFGARSLFFHFVFLSWLWECFAASPLRLTDTSKRRYLALLWSDKCYWIWLCDPVFPI